MPGFLPGCDMTPGLDSNEINILIIGETCKTFEEALTAKNENGDPDDPEEETKQIVNLYCAETIDPQKITWKGRNSVLPQRIDYIIVLIDPLIPSSLHVVDSELQFIDPVFLSRKRVDFCLVKHSMGESQLSKAQIRAFCTKYNTCLQCIRVDDFESVEYQARLCFKKAKQIICNPLAF